MENIAPAVGQIWQSWDSRHRPHGGTHIRITEVLETHVRCQRVRPIVGGGFQRYGKAEIAIKRIRLRPNSTGYRLVYSPPATEEAFAS